jgi:D-3-phosphoglycerate dehydrogenase
MTNRVVITDHTFESLDIEQEVLDEVDGGVELVDGEAHDGSLQELVADADAVIVMYEEISADVVDAMSDCRIISRTGIGLDNVDIGAATERGIMVTNVPDYCIDEVSTHTMALLLALKRNVVFYDRQTDAGEWDVAAGPTMHRLQNQTLGLVAFGRTAQEVGRKAAAFGMDVLAWDPYLDDDEIRDAGGEPIDDLADVLNRADVLSVHTPLNEETRGMIGAEEFERLSDEAVVLNVARGGIIDEEELADALDAGEIAGAGIDVLTEEPPAADHPLVGRDDVVLTPHAAWNSVESMEELRRKSAENVRAALEGDVPTYLVNDDVLD